MASLAADLDPLRTGADRLDQRLVCIELCAHLVEIGHLEAAAKPNRSGIRRELPEDQANQRALAGTVRADQAYAVSAQYAQRQIAYHITPAELFVDVLEFGDVRLRVPADTSARLRVESFSGTIKSDFGTVKREEFGPGSSLEERLGDGDGELSLESFSGDVTVQRD